MDHLPINDIAMLVSSVNCLLRDKEYDDLDEICNCFDVERSDLDARLAEAGYTYDEVLKRIR